MLSVMISGNVLSICSPAEGNRWSDAKDNRLFVEAVLYRYRPAFPGAICPNLGGFRGFILSHALEQRGVWQRVFEVLAAGRQRVCLDRQHDCAGPSTQC